jgi:hypothetical protein
MGGVSGVDLVSDCSRSFHPHRRKATHSPMIGA